MAEVRDLTEQDLLNILENCKKESDQARFDRIQMNQTNFDTYHLRQDWSYKIKGQSREFLPKAAMAVEQNSTFIRQGLVDIGEWFSVEPAEGMNADAMPIKPEEIRLMLQRQLDKIGIIDKMGDSLKLGFLGSLMIAKVTGEWVPQVKYKTKLKWQGMSLKKRIIKQEEKVWQLKIDLVRQQDFYPDPTGRKLYEIEDIWMDYNQVLALAQGDNAIYDVEKVKLLESNASVQDDQEYQKARETGQNTTNHGYRKQVKVTQYWGNVLDMNGNLVYENVVFTVANDRIVIQKPTPNPLWHGESPYIAEPIITVPHSVWGKALMDAPSMLNRAMNELFNLMLDGGLMSVHGIKQIRESWLEDPSQVEDGIATGDTLRVNASCPPGAQVLERVDTSTVPPEAMNIFNLTNQEFFTASLTNDLRLGASQNSAAKATAIVEASQNIANMFSGMATQIEAKYSTRLLYKAWMTIAQHTQDLDPESLKALFGSDRAAEIGSLSNEDLFVNTVQGCKFKVFGISATINKMKDFAKLQGLLQTIASSPVLMEEFVKKYDFGALLGEIMDALGINKEKLEIPKPAQAALATELASSNTPQDLPNSQSQIPQATAQGAESAIPQTEFPGSVATAQAPNNLGT